MTMALKEQLARQTVWSLANTFFSTFFGVASFFLLSHLLPREEIAIMGITAGFLALLAPLVVSPDVALFRNYAGFRKDPSRFSSAIFLFWAIRTAVLMSIILVAGYLLYAKQDFFLFLYLVGAGIVFNMGLLQASIQEFFFVEFKQEHVFKLNAAYHLIFLALLSLVYLNRSLWVYLVIWIILASLFTLVWVRKFYRTFHYRLSLQLTSLVKTIRELLSQVVIWSHLTASVMNLIYRADVFFLSFFTTAFVTGNYTIALMFSTLFAFTPQILQKMCIVGLTRTSGKENDQRLVSTFMKYSIAVGLAQVLFYYFLGSPILALITPENHAEIFSLGLYITIAVNLFNVVRPLHAYCFSRADLKQFFLSVFLPSGAAGVCLYAWGSSTGNALLLAQANILVYGILSLLLLVFSIQNLSYRFTFEWVSREERGLLKKIAHSFMQRTRTK